MISRRRTLLPVQKVDRKRPEKREEDIETTVPWYDPFKPLETLKNRGLVARDHLANERTLLLWIRCATSVILMGILACQFYTMDLKAQYISPVEAYHQRALRKIMAPIAGLCIMLGAVMVVFGLLRYFHVHYGLLKQQFPATRLYLLMTALVTLVVLVLILALDIQLSIFHPLH